MVCIKVFSNQIQEVVMNRMSKKKKIIIATIDVIAMLAVALSIYLLNQKDNDNAEMKALQGEAVTELEKVTVTDYYEEDSEAIIKLIEDFKADIEKAKKKSDIKELLEKFNNSLAEYKTKIDFAKEQIEEVSSTIDKKEYYEPEQADIDAILSKYEGSIKEAITRADAEALLIGAKEDLSKVLTKDAKDELVKSGEIKSVKESTASRSGANSNTVKKPSTGSSSNKGSSSGSSSNSGSSSSSSSHKHIAEGDMGWANSADEVRAIYNAAVASWRTKIANGDLKSREPINYTYKKCSCGKLTGTFIYGNPHVHIKVGDICGWKDTLEEVEDIVSATGKYWGDLLNAGTIDWDEYAANCAIGWSYFQCSCGKWSGNYKYY